MNTNQTSPEFDAFSVKRRSHNLDRMKQETFDLLVVGGGITGAGIASEAARWGYKVALVEKGDFAGGTSGKSSKLIHGGLRYLETLQFGLMFEACHQRHQLLKLAPHLVWPLPFIVPVYRDGPRPLWQIRTALRLYDTVVSFPTVLSAPLWGGRKHWPAHQIWPASQALASEPLLNPQGLVGAAHYYDCGTDDARLTLATLLEAHRAGATLANYAQVTQLLQAKNRIVGVQLCDQQRGWEIEVRARVIVSAVGAWTDGLLGLTGQSFRPWLHSTKGVHLVVRRERLPCQAAITFNSPRDGRFMFLAPWGNHVIVGTTDTDYEGSLDTVFATPSEVAYILEAVQQAFPSAHLSEEDVVSTYAGLRPLVWDQANSQPHLRSRQYRVDEVMPGLVTIAGGKLTLYRPMAWEVVNRVAHILAQEHALYPLRPPGQAQPPLLEKVIKNWADYQVDWQAAITAENHLTDEIASYLVTTYGPELPTMLKLLREAPALAERLTPALPVIKAQALHAIRHEMALTLEDVLDRRTHIMIQAADQGLAVAETVAGLMAAELGWTAEECTAQVAAYRQQVTLNRRWRERTLVQ